MPSSASFDEFQKHEFGFNGPRPKIEVDASTFFKPTRDEQEVFNILNEAAEFTAGKTFDGKPAILRVAGGWVRDKIMSFDNFDIDIAVDRISGEEMANAVRKFLVKRFGSSEPVHIVKINHEKSKHIASACIKIRGFSVDFTQLRSETYTSDSRIPDTKPANCFEDATRRDLTMNSLFFNLKSGKIEDFTGFGLSDIKNRIARTPIDPNITFSEDPLRVLRAVRFAARFSFSFSDDLFSAASKEEILNALETKVSRERIRTEIIKMAEDSNRERAFSDLINLGILERFFVPLEFRKEFFQNKKERENFRFFFRAVFNFTRAFFKLRDIRSSERMRFFPSSGIGKGAIPFSTMDRVFAGLPTDSTFVSFFFLASFFLPTFFRFSNIKGFDFDVFFKDAMKFSGREGNWFETLFHARGIFNEFFERKDFNTRFAMGQTILKICNKSFFAEKWFQCIPFAVIMDAFADFFKNFDFSFMDKEEEFFKKIFFFGRRFESFLEQVEKEDLKFVFNLKPLLTSDEICKLMNFDAPNRKIGEVNSKLIEWQLQNPNTTAEELRKMTLNFFSTAA